MSLPSSIKLTTGNIQSTGTNTWTHDMKIQLVGGDKDTNTLQIWRKAGYDRPYSLYVDSLDISGATTPPGGPGPRVSSEELGTSKLTRYYYKVRALEGSNFSQFSLELDVQFDDTADVTRPTLTSGPTVVPSTTSAVVTWGTSEASTSVVEYRTDNVFPARDVPTRSTPGPQSGSTPGLATGADATSPHSVTISNLTAGVRYYYRVRSMDAAGNELVGDVLFFDTVTTGILPNITYGPVIANVASTSCSVFWETDVVCSSKVEWTTDNFVNPLLIQSVTSPGGQFTRKHGLNFGTLATGTTYYYRVTATNTTGAFVISSVGSFMKSAPGINGALNFVRGFGGTIKDAAVAVAVDSSDNIIIAGYFKNTIDLGGGPFVTAGGADMFLAKYNSAGVHLWSKRYGNTGDEQINAIAVDASGNIFVVGQYTGTCNFGGVDFNTSAQGDVNAFIAKYSGSTGAHLWSHGFGGTGIDIFSCCAVDQAGNVYAGGASQGSASDFGGGNLPNTPPQNVVVAKYDTNGSWVWARKYIGGGVSYAYGLALDSNNILLTGDFMGYIDFGGGHIVAHSSTVSDLFVAKLNSSDGSYVWARGYGGVYGESGTTIAVDANNDVIVAGTFNRETDLGGGTITGTAVSYSDTFIVKYSGVNGDYVWARPILGDYDGAVLAVKCGLQNSVYATGRWFGTRDFGGQSRTTSGVGLVYDIFVAKYNSSGVLVWLKTYGATSEDAGYGLALDSALHPVVAGSFSLAPSFDGTVIQSGGGTDALLLKLNS